MFYGLLFHNILSTSGFMPHSTFLKMAPITDMQVTSKLFEDGYISNLITESDIFDHKFDFPGILQKQVSLKNTKRTDCCQKS